MCGSTSTQKILDPQTGLERNINTGFTVTYTNREPGPRKGLRRGWLTHSFGRPSSSAEQVLNESRFYATEADRQRAKIAESEGRLARFKEENFDRLPDTTQANLNVKNMTDQDLEGVERDLRTQQQNRTFILQQLQQARAVGANADTLRTLEVEYAKKAAVYDPNHPDMIALHNQIAAMRSGTLAAGSGSDLEAQLAAQRANLAQMRQRYSEDHPDVKHLERTIQELQARSLPAKRTKGPMEPDSGCRSAGNAAEWGRDANRRSGTPARGSARKGSESAKPPEVYAGGGARLRYAQS